MYACPPNGGIPVLGRFLSPDSYVQAPDFTQSFNRYSYCLNNPLIYTDPDGEFWHLIIGAAIGGTINWATHGCKFNAKGLGYFGVGALAGALGAGIGAGVSSAIAVADAPTGSFLSAVGISRGFAAGFAGTATYAETGFAAGFVSGAAGGFSSGFVSGVGNALIEGKDVLAQGWDYGWKGAIAGGIIGGIAGGIDAANHNRDFWSGANRQNVVVKVNAQGNGELISSADYSQGNQVTKDAFRTPLTDGEGITTSSNGDITIKIPDNINRITGIQAPDNTFFMNVQVGRKFISLTPLDRTKYIIMHGWRYTNNPVSSLRDIFYSRPITPIYKWF